MDWGFGPSKKYTETASFTLARNSSQVSPCVNMFSVRHSAEYPPSASSLTSKTNSLMWILLIFDPRCHERNMRFDKRQLITSISCTQRRLSLREFAGGDF